MDTGMPGLLRAPALHVLGGPGAQGPCLTLSTKNTTPTISFYPLLSMDHRKNYKSMHAAKLEPQCCQRSAASRDGQGVLSATVAQGFHPSEELQREADMQNSFAAARRIGKTFPTAPLSGRYEGPSLGSSGRGTLLT
jgi:hypothetical protein